MNSALMAVNDGIANFNFDEADITFIVGAVFAVLAAIAYAAGIGTIATPEAPPDDPADSTTKTPVGPATTRPYPTPTTGRWTSATWHYRFHELAAALLSLAVASIAFGLFLL